MDTKEIAQLVNYDLVSLGTQRFIRNGQEQTVEQKTTVVKCPACGEILLNMGDTIPDACVHRIINEDKDRLYARMKYCPHCGQKLRYEAEIIEDVEMESTDSQS